MFFVEMGGGGRQSRALSAVDGIGIVAAQGSGDYFASHSTTTSPHIFVFPQAFCSTPSSTSNRSHSANVRLISQSAQQILT